MRRGILVGAVALIVLLWAPSVMAAYEGPGQQGVVPLGDGGHLQPLYSLVGEGLFHVPLTGIGSDVCRIVLDENETYDRTLLVWVPGNDTAYVAAEPGQRDALFRIAAHWELDMNDECTVEVTPDEKIWHDPRGRPFIHMQIVERHVAYEAVPGNWTPVEAWVRNNGTLPEAVNITLGHMRPDWQIRNATGVVDVPVEPLQTLRVGFDLFIPPTETSGTKLLLLNMEGKHSGWADRATLMLEVQSGDEVWGAADDDEDEDRIDPRRARDAPTAQSGPTGQIPGPPLVVTVMLVALVAFTLARRRR